MQQQSFTALLDRTTRHWYILAILVVLWGTSFASTKIAVETIPPVWVAALRIFVGACLMLTYLLIRQERLRMQLGDWLWFLWLALLGTVVPFLLISWGVQHIPSSVAGILMATVPMGVIVLAHILLPDEPLTRRKMAGFLVGFVGVIFLVGIGGLRSLESGPLQLWSLLGITAAALCYALNGTTARLMPDMSSASKSAGVLLAGTLVALPLAFILSPDGLKDASMSSLWAVLALGIFPTALATILLFIILKEAGASFVALSNYLVPVFAVMIGVVLLGEVLLWSDWIGLFLVLCGIFITERHKSRKSAPT
ncbi:MAG: DMT family transporter [Hyphomicrobiales bacterium]